MKILFRSIVLIGLLSPSLLAQQTLAGEWMLTILDQFGQNVQRLSLKVDGEKLTGLAGNRPIEGTVRGVSVEFRSGNVVARGVLEGGELKGEVASPDGPQKWAAVRIPPRPTRESSIPRWQPADRSIFR
jgi:hypothetical protein